MKSHGTYIFYEDAGGDTHRWLVVASGDKDTSETLRDHVNKWLPNSTFLCAEYWVGEQKIFTYDEKENGYKRAITGFSR